MLAKLIVYLYHSMPGLRKKNIRIIILVIALLLITGYIFRYPLVLKFQYARLQSLDCSDTSKNPSNNCREKIFVHRVNSLERYELLKEKFSSFETDIVFDGRVDDFQVYHPPFKKETDIVPFDQFLGHTDLKKQLFWFDTRFVAAINMEQAMAALSRLPDTLMLQKRSVFEIYDAVAAAFFAQRGYTTSFNPDETVMTRMGKEPLYRDSINQLLERVTYISQDMKYVPELEQLFPGKQIVTWDLRFSSFFNRQPLRKLLDDPRVSIVMVNIQTPFNL